MTFMSEEQWVSRKELAIILSVTTRQVRANEKRWGLDEAKMRWNHRTVRYAKDLAEAALRARGMWREMMAKRWRQKD